jgi:hypothetical protein
MEKKFKLLRTFGVVFKVLAWAALVIGAIGTVGVLVTGGTPETPRAMSIVILIVGALYFVIFYTIGEVVKLLLAIEEQTRKTP